MKSGGSPSGVSEPPIFATMKMKKMNVCIRYLRCSVALRSGRIISIAAPVVPMMFASAAPVIRNARFPTGRPVKFPLI